jgi:site-specific recombinase XerD
MTRSTPGNLGASSKPALKSPLRVATMPLLREAPDATPDPVREAARAPQQITARQLRQMQISEFKAWLRTQTNKHRRPYQEETISDYAETASALDRWMAEEDIDGDFTACDVTVLNSFFSAYRNSHTRGGTNTRQRNLHHLFRWLAARHHHPDPWARDDLVRYGPVQGRPSTLAEEFIRDLLEVTGGEKAASFADVRDHAMQQVPVPFTQSASRC